MTRWLDTLRQDFRYALRMLRRSPAFTGAAILSLALGIGATTTIFSVIHAVVLEPFPYKDPDTLMSVIGRGAQRGRGMGSYYTIDQFVEIAERTRAFDGVMASTISDVAMIGTGEPERLRGNYVTMNTFDVMGVPPLVGRGSTAEDARPGAAPIAVLGYKFWQSRFGGSRDVLGQQLRLNGTVRTVVGVMPPRFMWRGADVYLPITFERGRIVDGVRTVHLLGRLKPGLTSEAAAADLTPILNDLGRRNLPEPIGPLRVELRSFKESFASSLREPLIVLLGAVGLLLLIACANVSNLLLARASAREREIAVRSSLGAGRMRLIRQLLTESVVLAAAGAALGVGLAYAGLNALLLLVPPDYIPAESEIAINRAVLLFTLALSVGSAIVFGLVPALQTARGDVVNPMRESGRSLTGSARQARLRNTLVIVEVALSVVLLMGAGLMIRTLMQMKQVSLGFEPERILSMRVPLDPLRYETAEERGRFFTNLLERVRALPGVSAAAVTVTRPPFAGRGSSLTVPGQNVDTSRGVAVNEASSEYFRLVNSTLLAGRTFSEQDVTMRRRLGVVNEAFVKMYHPNGDPIGRVIHLRYLAQPPLNGADDTVEIVGVTRNIHNSDVDNVPFPEVTVPYTLNGDRLYLLLATSLPPQQLERSARAEVYALDKDQPVTEVRPLDQLIDEWSFALPRFNLILFGIFAALGLLLATIGVYGVISYAVSRQTQEFGVRVALGAQKADILRMVLGSGLRLVVIGILLGCVAAVAAGRLLATQIWGVSPYDPLSFAVVIALLLIIGFQACLWPARRAAKVDPMVSLRQP
jgi:putative ABC transport system permease protein